MRALLCFPKSLEPCQLSSKSGVLGVEMSGTDEVH